MWPVVIGVNKNEYKTCRQPVQSLPILFSDTSQAGSIIINILSMTSAFSHICVGDEPMQLTHCTLKKLDKEAGRSENCFMCFCVYCLNVHALILACA